MSELSYNPLIAGLEEIRKSWLWFVFLGVTLAVFGAICLVYNVSATFTTVFFFGWLLLIGGIIQLIQSFGTGSWSGFFLFLLSALFRGFTGYLLLRYPVMGAESLTLLLASFFIVGGLFRAVGSSMLKFPRWGWSVFSGIVGTVLGILLLAQMPVSSIWFIGFAIGVDLICDGAAMISFGMAIHGLLGPAHRATA